MEASEIPTVAQLTDELAHVCPCGLGRPLYRPKDYRHIQGLVAIACELAEDPTLPVDGLIADVVVPAVRRLGNERDQQIAAILFAFELDEPIKETIARERERVRMDDRNARAAALAGVSTDYFKKRKKAAFLELVAEQVLALWKLHRAAAPPIDSPNTEALPVPDRQTRWRAAIVGGLLVVAGAAWLAVVATGGVS